MKITILTPTYNREKELNKLYNSLIEQTNKEFMWIIVADDGSNDGTEKIVRKWIDNKKINIDYRNKTNAGKHKTINYAMNYRNTELVFIVDSDDYLTNDAIDIIYKYHEEYKENKYEYIVRLLCLIYLLISSTAEFGFVNLLAIPLALILGIYYRKE